MTFELKGMNLKMEKINRFLFMNIGCILLAMGVYFFKIPNGFTTGGVSGISTILAQVTPISAGVWIWLLNFVLMILGFIFLGRQNGIKTVYCSMFYSAVTYIFEVFVPIVNPLTEQPFLELVYAMLLTSIGSAIIFNSDASSGGTDIALGKIYEFETDKSGNYIYDERKIARYNPIKNKKIETYPVPVKFWHCIDDKTVLYEVTEKFISIIKENGGIAYLRTFPHGGHEPQQVGESVKRPCGVSVFCGEEIQITPAVEETFIWIKNFS